MESLWSRSKPWPMAVYVANHWYSQFWSFSERPDMMSCITKFFDAIRSADRQHQHLRLKATDIACKTLRQRWMLSHQKADTCYECVWFSTIWIYACHRWISVMCIHLYLLSIYRSIHPPIVHPSYYFAFAILLNQDSPLRASGSEARNSPSLGPAPAPDVERKPLQLTTVMFSSHPFSLAKRHRRKRIRPSGQMVQLPTVHSSRRQLVNTFEIKPVRRKCMEMHHL